jgi:hypothetical protein
MIVDFRKCLIITSPLALLRGAQSAPACLVYSVTDNKSKHFFL